MIEIYNAETRRADFILWVGNEKLLKSEQLRHSQMSMLERWWLSMERLDWRMVRVEARRWIQALGGGLGGQWQRGRKGCKSTVLDDQGRIENKREKRAELRWLLWFRFGETENTGEIKNAGKQQVWGEKREMVNSSLGQLNVTAFRSSRCRNQQLKISEGRSESETHFPYQ